MDGAPLGEAVPSVAPKVPALLGVWGPSKPTQPVIGSLPRNGVDENKRALAALVTEEKVQPSQLSTADITVEGQWEDHLGGSNSEQEVVWQ